MRLNASAEIRTDLEIVVRGSEIPDGELDREKRLFVVIGRLTRDLFEEFEVEGRDRLIEVAHKEKNVTTRSKAQVASIGATLFDSFRGDVAPDVPGRASSADLDHGSGSFLANAPYSL
jgi:hypothetical protein